MTDFVVIGGGSMGTAVAYLLANNPKNNVLIWLRNQNKVNAINSSNSNSEYLPGLILPKNIAVTANLTDALGYSDNLILAIPSHAINALLSQIKKNPLKKPKILSVIKGFDHTSKKGISLTLSKNLDIQLGKIAVLSGPNFAAELVVNTPSIMVIACKNEETISIFKAALTSTSTIVYSTDDVSGVEIAAVLKNIIAIAMGIVDGLGFGANTRGAVFSVCIREALEIGTRIFNAKQETILGPACLGDAITTGFSSKSRNYLLGLLLAKKASLGESESSFICEGKNNIRLVRDLAAENHIYVPITEFVYQIINGVNAYQAFSDLWKKIATTIYC